MSKPKSLADVIRGIKLGKSKRIEGHTANTVRVTAARVLGAGNYSVRTVSSDASEVTYHGGNHQ